MLKKLCAFVFSCILMGQCFALPMNQDIEQIVKDGKLTVAFFPSDVSPYVYYDDNHALQGFDVVLANRIAQELDVKLDPIIAKNYNEAVEWVATKRAELAISNITRSPERGKYVLFSRPYNTGYLTVIENRSSATATDITREEMIEKYNQQGFVIGIAQGTVFGEIAKVYFPNAQIIAYADEKQMFADVGNKKINAGITDYILGKSYLKKSPELSLSVTSTKINDWGLEDAIVMDMNSINLMYWINLFLETLEQDGTLKNMRAQYLNNVTVK